ncbi:hypothetical protein [Aliidiomarina sp.]|uniref:hypothetical protein n=1 Tax=Aliidiomarina sp. TaxID=1872439 RepID=UPI003A4D8A0F
MVSFQQLTSTSMLTVFSVLCLLISAPAYTADNETPLTAPNWRLLDLGYAIEADRDSSVRADMLNLRASLPVYEYGLLQFESNVGQVSGRNSNPDMNAYQLNIMAGLRMAASEQADLFVLVGGTRVEMEVDDFNLSEHGFITQAGMRGRINERVDISSYVQYSKTGSLSTTSWHGEVRYNIANRVDLLLGGGVYSRALSGKVGISVHF